MKFLFLISLPVFLVCICLGLAAYASQTIVCPYCHNSNANTKGNCMMIQHAGQCPEDYYTQHHNLNGCDWCQSTGQMSRLTAFLD